MKQHNLDSLFKDLSGNFDTHTPKNGHEVRFLQKLNALESIKTDKRSNYNWKSFIAIAASIILCFSVFISNNRSNEVLDLANISPELSETQDFFTTTIENELKQLNKARSPLTETIITNAIKQLEGLEKDYAQLKLELTESGNDQRIIYAMITNFQNRIDLLNIVLKDIDAIKNLNTITNETENTF